MTLTELRYLLALAREKHFKRAAEQCCITQPTLSVAINKLESTLGVTIFERLPNEIRVTDVGERLIVQAQCVLEEAAKIKDIAQAGKSQLTQPLRIGGIHTVAPYLFPALMPKLVKIAPNMPLIIQESFTSELRVKLQRGELDAIFVALPFTERGVVTKKLYDEDFVVLLRKDHPLASKKAVTPDELAAENVLLLGKDHCFRDQVIDVCPQCHQTHASQQAIEGTSLETLRHMVASGMGITVLPQMATQVKNYHPTLCTKPFRGRSPTRTIALAWRASFPRVQAIDVVLKAFTLCKLDGVKLVV